MPFDKPPKPPHLAPSVVRRRAHQREVNRLRSRIYYRDRYECVYCESRRGPLRVDHWKPVTHGGRSDMSNLVTACESCDVLKGTLTGDEFVQLLRDAGFRRKIDKRNRKRSPRIRRKG